VTAYLAERHRTFVQIADHTFAESDLLADAGRYEAADIAWQYAVRASLDAYAIESEWTLIESGRKRSIPPCE
jgi:hypothetical protein